MRASILLIAWAALASLASAALFSMENLLCLINLERMAFLLPPVRISPLLDDASQKHSDEQARLKRMSHVGQDGSSPADRILRSKYNWSSVGECVATGYSTEAMVMAAWMSSPGHQAIIIDKQYTEVGMGMAKADDGTPYWTLGFGNRSPRDREPNYPKGLPERCPKLSDLPPGLPIFTSTNVTIVRKKPTGPLCDCSCTSTVGKNPNTAKNTTHAFAIPRFAVLSAVDAIRPLSPKARPKEFTADTETDLTFHKALSFWTIPARAPAAEVNFIGRFDTQEE